MHSDTLVAGSLPTLGRMLKGQYRIDEELGSGAMGVVYKGTHVTLGKPVAVKMLRVDGFSSGPGQERFEREARTASMLVHPSIAQVFDYGIEDGSPFLVMEFVDGKELADVIEQEGPMPPARAVAIMRQLASVLEEAHKHGVVHRDIKPQNLKLMRYSPGGQLFLKVLDFGIAKQVGSDQGKLTATGAVLGTPMYMAPEQAGGASSRVDGRADQYAAGIVLYEMLTGHVPFTGESLAGVLVSHLTQPPPPLPKSVPEPLRQIVERLLKKHPEERFPDCAALDRALQACESACRDVAPLQRDSVQPVASQGPARTGSYATTVGFGLGALAVAGATMFAVITYGPRLRQRGGATDVAQPGEHPAGKGPQAPPQGGPPQGAAAPVGKGPQVGAAGAPGTEPAPTATKEPEGRSERHHRDKKGDGDSGERAGAAGPLSPEAKAKLEEADRHFRAKQYQEAIEVARQSVGIQNSPRAWRLITLAYCGLGDLGNAKASFHRVAGGDRRAVLDRCQKSDVDLGD